MRPGVARALMELEAMLPEWTSRLRTPDFVWTQFDALAAPILEAAHADGDHDEVEARLHALLERHGLHRP
mgnify:CR=1 FL=1